MSQKLIKVAMDVIERRPPDAVNLFKEKYAELFKDSKLLEAVLNLPWSERAYKQICFLRNEIIPFISDETSEYYQYLIYTRTWFLSYWEYLPFEMYDSMAKEGIDLLKILLKEKKLKGYEEEYEKDKRYKDKYKKCEKKVKALLKDRTALDLLLNEEWGRDQYEKLIAFAYLIEDQLYYFDNPDPVFSLFQKYMYHWEKPYCQAVPFEDWKDLAKKSVDLLKELIDKDQLEKFEKNKKYISFFDQLNSHLKKISKVDPKRIRKNISGKDKVLLEEIIKVVKYPESMPENFFSVQERDFLIPFKNGEVIYELLKEQWSEQKYTALTNFADEILPGVSRRSPGIVFDVPPIYNVFREYIDKYNAIVHTNRPFEVYVGIIKEQVDLLKTLYEEGHFDRYKEDKRFQAFHERYVVQSLMLVAIGYAYPEDEWDCQFYFGKSLSEGPLYVLCAKGHPDSDFDEWMPKLMAPDWRFECFVNHCPDIFSDTWLLDTIMSDSSGKRKYDRLIHLTGIINRALSAQRYCDKIYFEDMLPVYDFFQEYIMNTCIKLRIETWVWEHEDMSDFDRELCSLFKEFADKNGYVEYKEDKKYIEFMKKYKPYIKKSYYSALKKLPKGP